MRLRLIVIFGALMGLGVTVYLGMIRPPAQQMSQPANALIAPLPAPTGEIILTVSLPDATPKLFDLAMLQTYPKSSFSTTTMWTEGTQHFDGVDLKSFLATLGVVSGTLIATAVNDYRIEIPIDEIALGGPMMAYHLNGAPMSLRDKGPLWIVYPYDSSLTYQTEVVFSRSIWQLNRLEIAP